ncbi:DUF5954 family protein [Streptomyces formicae]|uniref:PE-PGRS family protein n=1 Tax=Streptomyces formicae TaxID=1616117 RepID=A0ABY3WLY5_9ACTN|nr:DUF5954 family protein [Streptomyces formicae]UNM10853.1 PE-PGRS family protein [Streptomyces formicae]
MTVHGEGAPAYLTFRMTPQPGPIAAFAEEEALRARQRYPDLLGMGLPVFFYTRELDLGGWEILGTGGDTPQSGRDALASYFRQRASEADAAPARKKFQAAAEKLDWVVVNELKVLGTRYRVVRAEQFIRMGPDGPEPPRPSDPDPARPGDSHKVPSRTKGFVIDPWTGTGISEGLLKVDLARSVRAQGTLPDAMYADSVRARETHPGAVLLPAEFAVAERDEDGRWGPHTASGTTPQGARDSLALSFRVFTPVQEKLSEQEREEYARAANRLDEKGGAGITVAGRRFRVTRVEQLVRIGPDGPEGPRPSDHDPEPPIGPHTRQLKADGLWKEEDEEPEPLTGDALELWNLMRKEEARRAAQGLNRGREAPPR